MKNERNFINNFLLRIWPKSLSELFLNFYRLIYDSNLRKLLWNSINDLHSIRIIFLPSIHFQLFITTTIYYDIIRISSYRDFFAMCECSHLSMSKRKGARGRASCGWEWWGRECHVQQRLWKLRIISLSKGGKRNLYNNRRHLARTDTRSR